MRINYCINGISRTWDCFKAHSAVAVLQYHTERKAFLLVRQFRPPIYLAHLQQHHDQQPHLTTAEHKEDNTPISLPNENVPVSKGCTYELCAGLVDKNKSLEQIACEEVMEECGYLVRPEELTKVTSYMNSVGLSGSRSHLFYVEIDESRKVNHGGGLQEHGEFIELFFLPVKDALSFVLDEANQVPAGLKFAIVWFLQKFPERVSS
eukprot:TRINITY_DN796_c0_g1_i8.p1 TRINITY_DN796_c0_g1~~TRINITY_DN796_c0_g1_i8.p1  ORF type:complete len:235 (-),score=53.94 TRINITY_DN796_c0_g1_i8:166-786(-)